MADTMTFPKTVEEFMEEYKIVDSDQVYTNGAELVPIFRMKQWFEHIDSTSDAVPVVEEENILKFYYVRSIDEYWIGQRIDNFYYAEYDPKSRQWVWTHSRYLPWGEHIVSPTSLWKEHTYPSEPEEIPFAEWLQGFIKKHAADVVEVRHGRWEHGKEVAREYLGNCLVGVFYDRWTCSECGYVVDDHEYSRINYKFCPNCGAKMDGGVNDG